MPEIIAFVIEFAIYVCALWVLFSLSTFLHEVGHALGYMISTGDRHWHIRVGWGKHLLNTKRLTVSLLPFDGYFAPLEKHKIDTTAKLIAILSGGPAVSLILVIGLLLLKLGDVSSRSEIIAPSAVESLISSALFVNSVILVLSLIPTHYFYGEIKGLETDGRQIINAIQESQKQNVGPGYRMISRAKHPHTHGAGYVLYYTHQCPFNAKYMPIPEQTAAEHGVPFRAVRLDGREAAQRAPAPVTTYALFRDREYLTNEQMNNR